MEYCTGNYGDNNVCNTKLTGSLVKIIRNNVLTTWRGIKDKYDGIGSSTLNSDGTNGSSGDLVDHQLLLMLNGTNYLKTS